MKVKYTFYAEDGSHVSAVIQSEGMDSADKSSNKAMSAACKYALFQVFNIPTVEFVDPDATTPEPTVKKPVSSAKSPRTSMTLEEAKSFQSKEGKPYGEMNIQELQELLTSMLETMKRKDLTQAQKETLQSRITAIHLISDAAKKQ